MQWLGRREWFMSRGGQEQRCGELKTNLARWRGPIWSRKTRRADGESRLRKFLLLFHFVLWDGMRTLGWPLQDNGDHLPKGAGRRWPDALTNVIYTDNRRFCGQCVDSELISTRCCECDWAEGQWGSRRNQRLTFR